MAASHFGVALVVRVGDGELAQRPEMGLDRVGPRAIGRGEGQLDGVLRAPRSDHRTPVVVQVVQDHVDHLAVGDARADGLEGPQRRAGTFLGLDASIEAVGTHRVPGEELPGPVRLVVVGPQPLWPRHLRPARPTLGLDGERSELVEGKGALALVFEEVLDEGQLLLAERVGRLLPGLGALEGDPHLGEDLAETLSRDDDPAPLLGCQVAGQLAHAPAGEGLAEGSVDAWWPS